MNHQPQPIAELRLSLEELALIFSLLGQAPLAKAMLTNELGEQNADELRGRVMAASNTLLAKGVFRVDGENMAMDPAYTNVLTPMLNADYALLCTGFSTDQPERSVMFYIQGERIVEHRSYQGLYHSLQAHNSLPEAVGACEAFFQMPEFEVFEAVPFELDQEQIQGARFLDEEGAAEIQERLERLGVNIETANRFTEDLRYQHQWAVVLRLQTIPDEGIVADIGYEALIGSSGRTWLITVDGENGRTALHVRPAAHNAIRDLTRGLFTSELFES